MRQQVSFVVFIVVLSVAGVVYTIASGNEPLLGLDHGPCADEHFDNLDVFEVAEVGHHDVDYLRHIRVLIALLDLGDPDRCRRH